MNRTSPSPLQAFLASAVAARAFSIDEVRGFVLAVAGTPDLVPPSEWLPEVFGGDMPQFESLEQARSVMEELTDLYNSALAGGRRLRSQAPEFREETIANLEDGAPVQRWSHGSWRGYGWLRESWNGVMPEDQVEELASILLVLSFFSSRKMAETCREETGNGKSLEEFAEIMRKAFGKAMVAYIRLGQSLHGHAVQ